MYKSQIQSILQLDSHSKRYFKGVFAIDELPRLLPMSGYVINYDEHNKEGSHWVAVFANAKTVEYFDPNGQQPLDKRLSDFIGPNYLFSPFALQQILGNACGFYCTYFILKRSRNCTANNILSILTRINSDFIVKTYIYSHYKPFFV